jgi:hypothetical protein
MKLSHLALAVLAAAVAINTWREKQHEKQMDNVTDTLKEIHDSQKKVFRELGLKIDRLIAAQGTLTPEAQVVADEIKADLAAKDAENPDEPETPEDPQAVS